MINHFLNLLLLIALSITLCILTSVPGRAQTPDQPLLYSEATSTRALALDALTFSPEPFSPSSSIWFGGVAGRPRIMLFARAQSSEDLAAMTAEAEDASHHRYQLTVEDVRQVPGQAWLSQIILTFDEDVGDVGDVLIRISNRGVASNRVRVGIGHVGGGPADDPGALPTPAPPYTIAGRVTSGTTGLGGVLVTLSGPQAATATTDQNGVYSINVMSTGSYTITVSKSFYSFTPSSKTLNDVSGNRIAQDFSATRQLNSIDGRVQGDQNNNLAGISVVLSSNADDFEPRVINTGNDGLFSFKDLPAGDSYTVAPTATSVFTFNAHGEEVLDSDLSLSFHGIRRSYDISGVIANPSNQPVSGVTVTLSGAVSKSATTGLNGSYFFDNLPAGFSYHINVAKTDFIFEPGFRTFELLSNEVANFTALRAYRISGRVADGNGAGIAGVRMIINGAEQHTAATTSDGSYLLTLTTSGSYFLAPANEQGFYTFTPVSRSIFVTNNHTANFTGAFSAISNPGYVLEFDGTPMTVDYGDFWPVNVGLGHFFWEFWAMPGPASSFRYLVSDGYGGTHALLFGFGDNVEAPRYSLFGNIWNGSTWVFFDSDDGPLPNEWGHYAVGWDGSNIITYYDGVPAGKVKFKDRRICMGRGWGAGMPLLGGSDHSNLIGRVAQVRAYEGTNPRATAPEVAFAPQTLFSREGQLLSYFFRPAQTVADLSFGYKSVAHAGLLRGFNNGYVFACPSCPIPKYVIDPTAPNFSNFSAPGTITTPSNPAPTTPSGAVIFDSFSRSNSTHILGGKGGLGTTEAGSAGPQTWQSSFEPSLAQPFGILGGRAVLLANQTNLAWVPTGSNANLEIRVDRRLGRFGSGLNTGVSFRVVNNRNFFFAYTSDFEGNPSALSTLTLGFYQSGIRTVIIDNVPITSDTWKTLRVVTRQSGAIEIYTNDILVYSTTSSAFATATGAGLYNNGPGLGLTNRWDNFTVFPAQ